jgi:hypothetical protein
MTIKRKNAAINFLRDYSNFGSWGNFSIASLILENYQKSEEDWPKKLLALKMAQEFASSIENLGAICVSIKHRNENAGIIFNLLSYDTFYEGAPSTRIRDFFYRMKRGNQFFKELGFPSPEEFDDMGLDLHKFGTQEYWKHPDYPLLDNEGEENNWESYYQIQYWIESAADNFLRDKGSLYKSYAKLKHGFMTVENGKSLSFKGPDISNDSAYVIRSFPSKYIDGNFSASIGLTKFPISNIEELFSAIWFLGSVSRTLCLLSAEMIEMGIISSNDDIV